MRRLFIAIFILFTFYSVSCVEMDFPTEDWVEKTPESQGVNPDKLELARFGHLFLNRGNWDRNRKWPSAPPATYAALGHNNNVCLVIPEWNRVIVRLGIDGNIPDAKWDNFLKLVSESMD